MITLTREGGKGNVEQQKPEANELLENMGAKLRALFPSGTPGAVEKVRLIGIDAPEVRTNPHGPAHELGPAAGLYLAQLLNGATVRLETGVRERDHYGRVLAYVYRAETFINLEMVRAGYAKTATYPPDVAHADEYLAAEREARAEGRGLWQR